VKRLFSQPDFSEISFRHMKQLQTLYGRLFFLEVFEAALEGGFELYLITPVQKNCSSKARPVVSVLGSPHCALPFLTVAVKEDERFEGLFLQLTSVPMESLLDDHGVHLVELRKLLPVGKGSPLHPCQLGRSEL